MIGQAEIEELMSEYAEALKKHGLEAPAEAPSWPLTRPIAPDEAQPVTVRIPEMFRWPLWMLAAAANREGGPANERKRRDTRT